MFDQLEEQARARKLPRYALLSIVAHALVIALFGVAAYLKVSEPVPEKKREVVFIGPGHGSGPPPPPPPLGSKKTPKRTHPVVHKVEIPKVVPIPKVAVVEPPKVEKKVEEEVGQADGVKGGVVGGVTGGVVNGVVGSNGGGGTVQPPAPPPPSKPKNVPPFVIKRDEISTPPPRMSEVYKATHRGQTLSGAYRICVGVDGHVFDVIPTTSIAGADEAMIEGIKGDWLYKPQKVPVCFMYNASIRIE